MAIFLKLFCNYKNKPYLEKEYIYFAFNHYILAPFLHKISQYTIIYIIFCYNNMQKQFLFFIARNLLIQFSQVQIEPIITNFKHQSQTIPTISKNQNPSHPITFYHNQCQQISTYSKLFLIILIYYYQSQAKTTYHHSL